MTGTPAALPPAMQQYVQTKARYEDCILLFRMGDFYEMFFDDAVTASRVLDLTLTSRNKGKEDSIPLCGFPYHAASTYIAKLIAQGFKVAICEQMEDPRLAKGVVKREVVRVVTPGLVVEADNLEAKENNFLAALAFAGGAYGLAFLDISTGEFRLAEFRDRDAFLDEVGSLSFREILLAETFPGREGLGGGPESETRRRVETVAADYFAPDAARKLLRDRFSAEALRALDVESFPAALAAAGAILRYAVETQQDRLGHVNELQWYESSRNLILDDIARRNLELFSTITEGRKAGSLYHVLDETMTAMGGRRLRWWLSYPLRQPERIRERLAAVADVKERHLLRQNLRRALGRQHDLERLGARIAMGVANARDLVALRQTLQALPEVKGLMADLSAPLLVAIREGIDEMPDVLALAESAIADDPPLSLRDGGLIREGFDAELDRLTTIGRDGRKWIAALEERERRRTGIGTLKVSYNSVFGYYIEITKANADHVPDDYIRKQTLVNAERYINQELKEYESTVLNADDARRQREYDLFVGVRERMAGEIRRMQKTAGLLADLDALASLAEVAERYGYACPVVDDEDVIEIRDGRHPVVERMPLPEGFVPNDVLLDLDRNRLLVITGPNMAGKSTYIRQVALIVLMAQMGSFVPAASARIGCVDRIFTRVGAADSLARGQSTFMVEMTEVANILSHATSRSLVILDEVGRGTSTFDGLSIAWAVAERLHDAAPRGVRSLFATHYHQLTELAATKTGVANFNIAVKEWGNRIIFLRKIKEGGTNRSYGIQVARIAGVPEEVIGRAKEILDNLEKGELDPAGKPKLARGRRPAERNPDQLGLFMGEEERVLREIRDADIPNLTPVAALNRLNEWKKRLEKG